MYLSNQYAKRTYSSGSIKADLVEGNFISTFKCLFWFNFHKQLSNIPFCWSIVGLFWLSTTLPRMHIIICMVQVAQWFSSSFLLQHALVPISDNVELCQILLYLPIACQMTIADDKAVKTRMSADNIYFLCNLLFAANGNNSMLFSSNVWILLILYNKSTHNISQKLYRNSWTCLVHNA